MKLGIVGSRNFPNHAQVVNYVNALPQETIVISGGATNVDTIAIATAKAHGLSTIIHLPDTTGCSQRFEFTKAYYARNQHIANDCEKLIAFTEKDTGGTWDTIRRVRKLKKLVEVIRPLDKPIVHRSPNPNKGKGPFHLKRVGFGSAALHLKKYYAPSDWADILNMKRDNPIAFGELMLPDFLAFFHTHPFGTIHGITQPPKSQRNLHLPHPMDVVCAGVATALHVPVVECFVPWEKPHRGVCLSPGTITTTSVTQEYIGKILFVLDDISTSHTTLRLSCAALTQKGIHCHGVAYVRY